MSECNSDNDTLQSSELLNLKLKHISERMSDPPVNILEQLQQMAHDSIEIFHNAPVIDTLKSWLKPKTKNTPFRVFHFASMVLQQVCDKPVAHGLLDCYLYDALGLRLWVDVAEMRNFVQFILSFMQQNSATDENAAAAVHLISSSIMQRTQESSSAFSIVRTAVDFCCFPSVRLAATPLLDRCIANATLSDLFAQLMRQLAKHIASASMNTDGYNGFLASDIVVVDKLVNMQSKLKLSQQDAYHTAVNLLISHKPTPESPVSINVASAIYVAHLLLAIDVEGKECAAYKLLIPAFNKDVHSIENMNTKAGIILGEACKKYLLTADKLLQLKHVVDWIMRMMRGVEHVCWFSFHRALLASPPSNTSLELLHFYGELSVTVQYNITLDYLKANSVKTAAAKAPSALANRRGGAVARGRGRGTSQSSIFRQGVRDKITESEVGNALPVSARTASMSSDQFLFLLCSLRCLYLQWLSAVLPSFASQSPSRYIEWMQRVTWVNPSLNHKEQEKYVVLYLRDHSIITTNALTAIVDVITTALAWCRANSSFFSFYTRQSETDSTATVVPQTYVDTIISALDLVEHHVKRSIKTEYLQCNAFLADDPKVFDKLMSLVQLEVVRRKLPKAWTASITDAPLPLPPLTCRRLHARIILLFCLMGAVRRDTLGCYLWNNHPTVRRAFVMMISNNYSSYNEGIIVQHSKSEHPNVSNELISVQYSKCVVSLNQFHVLVSTPECAEAAIRHAEQLVWDLLHASLTKRSRRRSKSARVIHNSSMKRKRIKRRSRRRKKKRIIAPQEVSPIVPPQETVPIVVDAPIDSPPAEPIDGTSVTAEEATGPVLRRSARIRTARFNIQELLQSDESESESEAESEAESGESEVDSESDEGDVEADIDLTVTEEAIDTLGLSNGHFALKYDVLREDLMFLTDIPGIGRELDISFIDTLRSLESRYNMAELLRQCTDPDFILLAVGNPSSDEIGRTLKWLGPLLCDSCILLRIPYSLSCNIFRHMCLNIVIAMYECNIWNATTDKMTRNLNSHGGEAWTCANEVLGGADLFISIARSVADNLSQTLEERDEEVRYDSFYADIGHSSKYRRVSAALCLSILKSLMRADDQHFDQDVVISILEAGAYHDTCFDLLNTMQQIQPVSMLECARNALLYECNSRVVNEMLKLLNICGQPLFQYMLTFSRRQSLLKELISQEGSMIVELMHALCDAFSAGTINSCIPTDEYSETTLWKCSVQKKENGKKGLAVSLDAVRVLCATLATVVSRAKVAYTCDISEIASKYPISRMYTLVCDILNSSPCGYLSPILGPLTCSSISLSFPCDVIIPMLCDCDVQASVDFASDAIRKIFDHFVNSSKKLSVTFKLCVNEYTRQKLLHVASKRKQCEPAVQYILEQIDSVLPATHTVSITSMMDTTITITNSNDSMLALVQSYESKAIREGDVWTTLYASNEAAKSIIRLLCVAAERKSALQWCILPYLRGQAPISLLCQVVSSLTGQLVCLIPVLVHGKDVAAEVLTAFDCSACPLSTIAAWYEISCKRRTVEMCAQIESLVDIALLVSEESIEEVMSKADKKRLPALFQQSSESTLISTNNVVYDNIVHLLLRVAVNDATIAETVARKLFTCIVEQQRMDEIWIKLLLSGLYMRHPQTIMMTVRNADTLGLSKDERCILLSGIVEMIYLPITFSPSSKSPNPCVLDVDITFSLWQLVKSSLASTQDLNDACVQFLQTLAKYHPLVLMQYYTDIVQILQTMAMQCERSSTSDTKSRTSLAQEDSAVNFAECILECMLSMTLVTIEIANKWEQLKEALGLCLRIAAAVNDDKIAHLVRRIREQVKDDDNIAHDNFNAIVEKMKIVKDTCV